MSNVWTGYDALLCCKLQLAISDETCTCEVSVQEQNLSTCEAQLNQQSQPDRRCWAQKRYWQFRGS